MKLGGGYTEGMGEIGKESEMDIIKVHCTHIWNSQRIDNTSKTSFLKNKNKTPQSAFNYCYTEMGREKNEMAHLQELALLRAWVFGHCAQVPSGIHFPQRESGMFPRSTQAREATLQE